MKRWLFVLALLVPAQGVLAAPGTTPFQFAAPGLRAPDVPDVSGMRFSILHGRNRSTRGVDLGLLSLSDTTHFSGFSAILGMGRVSGTMNGLATGLINVHTSRDTGVNMALVNRVNTVESGANVGVVNTADGYTMLDLGALNVSDRSSVQIGVLNITKKISGVQLGLLNIAENGFLPMFPFFNFPTD